VISLKATVDDNVKASTTAKSMKRKRDGEAKKKRRKGEGRMYG
jgi:hypothetical protein